MTGQTGKKTLKNRRDRQKLGKAIFHSEGEVN